MRRLLVATALASVALAGGAAAAPPEVPKLPSNCHEWNDLLGIDNVRSCDDPPAASEAAPPQLVGVHQRSDGAICVTISQQVPQCTPPLD
jgi:hypothetical protein